MNSNEIRRLIEEGAHEGRPGARPQRRRRPARPRRAQGSRTLKRPTVMPSGPIGIWPGADARWNETVPR